MEKKVVHEVKLQTSVIVILGVMAFGILGLAFKGLINDARASHNEHEQWGYTEWNILKTGLIATEYNTICIKGVLLDTNAKNAC